MGTTTSTVTLEYDDSVEFYRALVRIEGRTLNAKAVVTANLDDVTATTQVEVTRKEEGPDFRVRLTREEWGSYRGIVENERDESGDDIRVIKIAGLHPALAPYLGERLEGQNSPVCRSLMAEIVADVAARYVVSELYRLRRSYEGFDAERLYREHYRRVTRFLPRFQKILVGEPEVARISQELPPVAILEGPVGGVDVIS